MNTTKRIAMILRGHERNTFKTQDLCNFLYKLSQLYSIDFYIHTWNTSVGEKSWRNCKEYELYPINQELVKTYFSSIQIKSLEIDDETNIQLHGNQDKNVCSGPCPRIAWKRMWYGKFKAIELVKKSEIHYDFVINTRFDILKFQSESVLLEKINNVFNKRTVLQVYFLQEEPIPGIDNFYISNTQILYILFKNFHENLGDIEIKYPKTWYTEYLVFYESLLLNYKLMLYVSQKDTEVHNFLM